MPVPPQSRRKVSLQYLIFKRMAQLLLRKHPTKVQAMQAMYAQAKQAASMVGAAGAATPCCVRRAEPCSAATPVDAARTATTKPPALRG